MAPRIGPDRVTFDLVTDGARDAEADRLVALGATRTGDETLADPDGTEFRLPAQ